MKIGRRNLKGKMITLAAGLLWLAMTAEFCVVSGQEKSWDARVWQNDPMHGVWVRDAAVIALPLIVEASLSKIKSLIPVSDTPRHVYLTETEFWNIDPNARNIIHHIKYFSDGSVRELRWLVNYNNL